MTTQLKATVNTVQNVNARINNIAQPRVTALSYGKLYAIKAASDLNFPSFADGDIVSYNANNQTFVAESPITLAQNIENYINLDAGFF
jgi:hypothetical protein